MKLRRDVTEPNFYISRMCTSLSRMIIWSKMRVIQYARRNNFNSDTMFIIYYYYCYYVFKYYTNML